jgi:hypothetical protein
MELQSWTSSQSEKINDDDDDCGQIHFDTIGSQTVIKFYASTGNRENQLLGFVITVSKLAGASWSVSRPEAAIGMRKRKAVPTPSVDSNSTEP